MTKTSERPKAIIDPYAGKQNSDDALGGVHERKALYKPDRKKRR